MTGRFFPRGVRLFPVRRSITRTPLLQSFLSFPSHLARRGVSQYPTCLSVEFDGDARTPKDSLLALSGQPEFLFGTTRLFVR